MGKRIFNFKPIVNKRNGQISFSLRKKDLPKALKKDLSSIKGFRFKLEGFDLKK